VEQKFVTIQNVDICEATWYKIVGISRSTHTCFINKITNARQSTCCMEMLE